MVTMDGASCKRKVRVRVPAFTTRPHVRHQRGHRRQADAHPGGGNSGSSNPRGRSPRCSTDWPRPRSPARRCRWTAAGRRAEAMSDHGRLRAAAGVGPLVTGAFFGFSTRSPSCQVMIARCGGTGQGLARGSAAPWVLMSRALPGPQPRPESTQGLLLSERGNC
jgi:hypothetical protein